MRAVHFGKLHQPPDVAQVVLDGMGAVSGFEGEIIAGTPRPGRRAPPRRSRLRLPSRATEPGRPRAPGWKCRQTLDHRNRFLRVQRIERFQLLDPGPARRLAAVEEPDYQQHQHAGGDAGPVLSRRRVALMVSHSEPSLVPSRVRAAYQVPTRARSGAAPGRAADSRSRRRAPPPSGKRAASGR